MSMPIAFKLAAAAVAALAFAAAPALAETVDLNVSISGDAANPPIDTAGTGTLEGTYDTETRELTWTITYSDLSGPVVAGHFHGPATAAENAGVVLPLEGDLASPITGSATLSEEQAADFTAGLWYINLHTEQNPGGEIRGQAVAGDDMMMEEDSMMEDDAMGNDDEM